MWHKSVIGSILQSKIFEMMFEYEFETFKLQFVL